MIFETFGGLPNLSLGARGRTAGIAGGMVQGEGVQDGSTANRSRGRIGSGRGPGGAHGVIGKWQDRQGQMITPGEVSRHLRFSFGQAVTSPCKIGSGCEGKGHSQTPPKRGAEFLFLKKGRRCRH
jgi:hypothetical protein